jgi:hypothetical protein
VSKLSTRQLRQLKRARNRTGVDVRYNGKTYRATTSVVAGAITGAQTLSIETFGPFVASADSREFQFSPQDFAPWTDVLAPQEGQILEYNGLRYLVTALVFEALRDDTTAVICRAFRHING